MTNEYIKLLPLNQGIEQMSLEKSSNYETTATNIVLCIDYEMLA